MRSAESLITAECAKKLIRYDPETGLFYRIGSRNNKNIQGKDTSGYLRVMLCGKRYKLHRLAFLLVTGSWPDSDVDHINGVRDDNRWSNLRRASRQQNTKNTKLRSDNTSGAVGVSWHATKRKWCAYIGSSGNCMTIGAFDNRFDALAARKSAEIKYDFHVNHGRSA